MALRLFAALEPPEAVRRHLATVQAELRRALTPEAAARAGRGERGGGHRSPGAGAVKWVEVGNVHLTLHFLGAAAEEALAGVTAAVRSAAGASRPLQLEVRGAGAFPGPQRARVLWAGVGGEVAPLGELAAALGALLAPLGFPPEDRPFRPHLTLGRARDQRGVAGLGAVLAQLGGGAGVLWQATELVLFRSHLSPAGPRYEALERARLGG